ncbi:hypothetical protein HZF24_05535 [Sedimentibacter hydroxybenzoicus DSM 7310]|uniref:Uncharacterized protein n=1 Tax=Sedimentibacter hydroxybenzoicus DSM 7310 TaxID=1123245 RepID=A0A974GVP9_SEDHY|nr:hypothetical protein [Sedimentibacter hydroxybenzoicus]NYB73599.1 hypothetical protein [Sedimentibacter hydroxybenzoicus DSM 7310]
MNIEVYFNRIYSVAFQLTGDKEIAEEISTKAIMNTISNFNKDNEITVGMFKLTILELFKIYLIMPKSRCNDNIKGIQSALLKLKPVNRALVIWKDILGFKLSDNTPLSGSYGELYKELIYGRKELKEHISIGQID